MLKFKNVSKIYGNSNKNAVSNLSFEVKAGEIFGFLGPNGAGKSTTIKMATGIISITEGDIIVDGHSVTKDGLNAKINIGYVSDNHAVYDKLSGSEYLSFLGAVYKVKLNLIKERIEKYAHLFSMTDVLGDQISTYSHGMKQKIAVMGALIHDPKVWILDEPLTGLDPNSAFHLKQLMREHADKGNVVFFSSHVIDVVEKVCDRVAIIKNGQLVLIGELSELKENSAESLENIFLDIVK